MAHALKTLHRATLIGETTGGGAHAAEKALVEARKHLLKSFVASEKSPRAKARIQDELNRL